MLTAINFLLQKLEPKQNSTGLVLGIVCFLCLSNSLEATAQITPDTTLPSNSVVTPNGDIIEITEGTAVGNNLFHSFEEFSVLNGQTAFFDNGLTIENIFSRITGSSISNIEGLIRANGTANLFLINPNGIIFGENASLNIGGSFIGSTANSIQFSDGSFYSAVNPEASPLLTVSIPVGLQYGENSGNILVQGSGNSTGFADPGNNDFSLIKDFRPSGLQVTDGNTLALVGGNVALDGGNLTAAEGHIELGSIKEGLVEIENSDGIWQFDYDDVTSFQNIDLVNAASVEVSGNSSGTVNVQGQNISVADASAILANTSGNGTAGSINLNGQESVQITGTSQNEIPMVALVSTDTTTNSTGDGADLNIETSYLLVAGGAQVNSAVFGAGEGGDLTVKAERVELISGSPVASSSGLFAPIVPGSTGDGGDINLEADSLLVAGGAQAFTLSFGSGKGGDFDIKAKEIELNSTSPNGTPSGLFTNTRANGDGGNLTIETDNLRVLNAADIGSNVYGVGTGGNISIKADNIELNGLSDEGISGQISVAVQEGGAGIAGNIIIDTNTLTLADGTQINSGLFGSGEGGNIVITAQEIDLQGLSPADGSPSGLFTTVVPGATGTSGDITIDTGNLSLAEGAQISVSTAGSGTAGNLTVTASNSIELKGNAFEQDGGSSGLFSTAVLGDGDGGNINLTTDRLTIEDGATISASNFSSRRPDTPAGTGSAGNINIDAKDIELDGVDNDIPSSITAATFAGGGGNIVINGETITAENGSKISADTLGEGDGGAIEVAAKDVTITTDATISSSTIGAGDAGSISVDSESLNINSEGIITTSSTGTGQAGDINLNSPKISTNQGFITATSEQSGGGDINITTDFLRSQNNSLISTSVLDSNGGGGNIKIDSNTLLATNNSDIRANAVLGSGGNIDITTELIFTSPSSDIDASSQFGLDGVVEINNPDTDKQFGLTKLPDGIGDSSQLITSSCPVDKENVMAVVGKGGLSENPQQSLRGQSVWQDLRLSSAYDQNLTEENNSNTSVEVSKNSENTSIIEAKSWVINEQGNVELLSYANNTNHRTLWQHSVRCSEF